MKRVFKKRLTKSDRQEAVLLGLVDLFIKTNRPIGSHSLQEKNFDFLSSATIRNYFNKLEKEGYLHQSHSSGGRIPTALAYRAYANASLENPSLPTKDKKKIFDSLKLEGKQTSTFLHNAADLLSEMSNLSVFLTSPRFDQDFIHDIKLFQLDEKKILCVLLTDFGTIKTETLYTPKILEKQHLQQIENFFLYKLGKTTERLVFSTEALAKIAQHFYNEIMVRHIVGYAHFFSEEIYRTGLSRLLRYPEFTDPVNLAKNLALFEDNNRILSLLAECMKINRQTCWIGTELQRFAHDSNDCTVIAIPYYINHRIAGAIAILGPMRIDYSYLFGLMQAFSNKISQELSSCMGKFKITYRQPSKDDASQYFAVSDSILLEDKSQN